MRCDGRGIDAIDLDIDRANLHCARPEDIKQQHLKYTSACIDTQQACTMTRVSRWYKEHPVPCSVKFLETSVRVLNLLLAALGIAMLAWSIYTFLHLPPGSAAGPEPDRALSTAALMQRAWNPSQQRDPQATVAANAAGVGATSDAGITAVAAAGGAATWVTWGGDSPVPESPAPQLHADHIGCPWFVYGFGAAGAATFLTASTAIVGTALRSKCCIGLNVFLMCVVLTAQACLAVALFVDKSWEQLLPPETSGEYEKAKEFVLERLTLCKWVGVGLFCMQLLTLLLSCGLQSAYSMAEDAAEDAEEESRRRLLLQPQPPAQTGLAGNTEASRRAQRSSGPVMVPAAPSTNIPERNDSWSQRMKQRYGLDTRTFTYDPERQVAQQPGPPQSDTARQQRGQKCTIM